MNALSSLNDDQRRAATASGCVVIIAGPGTGKTKTLTARIAHLVHSGQARADQILALTFTKKAAREMRARAAPLVNPAPRITTFHSFCFDFLREQGLAPACITEAERLALIASIRPPHMTTRELSLHISRCKNSLSTDQLTKKYTDLLHQQQKCDFDDLLQQTYQLLTTNQQAAANLQQRYTHVLVDEFQDTNELQYALLPLIGSTKNLFVIGDPLQSIYGFRGANATIFQQFTDDYPAHTRVTLTANYRSAQQVVHVANAVFADAPQLVAKQQSAGHVAITQVLDEYTEAAWIINRIEQAIGGSDLVRSHQQSSNATAHFADFAVLYRTHHVARILQNQLAASGLPYQVVGEGSPYEQPAIKKIIAHMRSMANGELTTPPHAHVGELAQTIASNLHLSPSPELAQFLNSLLRFTQLNEFLQHLNATAEDEFYDPKAQAITLLTIHAAKGLEFTHVFLIGAQEGVLPLQRKTLATNIAEEQRLFYVAITRAKQQLDILHAKTRHKNPAAPSTFLDYVPVTSQPDENLIAQQQKRLVQQQRRRQARLL